MGYFDEHGPAYRIVTSRLELRCWDPAYAEELKTAIDESIDELLPFMPWARFEPQTVREKTDLIRRFRGEFDLEKDFVYGIFDRETDAVIGGTGLHTRLGDKALEIGYWIRSSRTGEGFATEAASALIKTGFELSGVDRLEIHCDARNAASARVIAKLGLEHEGTLKRRLPYPKEKWGDLMVWSIFRDRYPSSPHAALELTFFDAAGKPLSAKPVER